VIPLFEFGIRIPARILFPYDSNLTSDMPGKLFAAVLFCLWSGHATAQQFLYDGILEYAVKVNFTNGDKRSATGEEIAVTLYLKGVQSRLDLRSSAGNESSVFDSRSGQGFVLRDYSGQKLLMHANAGQWEAWSSAVRHLKFTDSDSVYVIGGYSCKLARSFDTDGISASYKVYYDPFIKISNHSHLLAPGEIHSLIVKMEVTYPDSQFSYELKSLSFEPPSSMIFEIPRKGYRTVEWEESMRAGQK
jgi:hypothetical protein